MKQTTPWPVTAPFLALLLFSLTILVPGLAIAQEQEEELFLVAQKAFDDGFYDVGIRYIEQFLQKYPQSPHRVQAQLLLGQCYFFQSQYLKAFEIFQSLLNVPEYKDATLYWLGETYFKGADYTEAEKLYQQLINLYPGSVYIPQAHYSLGWTYFEKGDFRKAKEAFLQIVKKFPEHRLCEDASFKVGESAHNLNLYAEANQYFQDYISKYPQSTRQAEALFYIAEGYYYSDDHLTAITYYAKAADIAYDRKITVMSKVSMGWCYLKLEKIDLSRRYFEEAEAMAKEHDLAYDDIYLGLASLYSETNENLKAREAYRQLIEKFPQSPRVAEAYLGKANIDYALKDYQQAIAGYRWLIEKYQEDPQRQELVEKAYYGLAWTFLKAGMIDESIKHFEDIMNQTKSKVVKISALTQIGDAYQDTNELERAIEVYDRILRDYPDSLYSDYVQFRQGLALLKLNRVEAAMLSFQSLEANFPTSKYLADVKYYLGVAYFKKEEWEQTIKHVSDYLQMTAKTKPFASEAHYLLASSYFNIGKYAEALKSFEDILSDPSQQKSMAVIAEVNIAKCLYHLGQTQQALAKFTAIKDQHPTTDTAQEALLWLANHHLENDQPGEALKLYDEFLNKFPGSEKLDLVHYEMGQAHELLAQKDQALEQYRQVQGAHDQEIFAKARLAIADIFSQEAEPKLAIETYLNVASSIPDFERNAYVKIAVLEKNNQRFPQAIEYYEKALRAKMSLSGLKDAELQFQIGDCFEILHDNDRAVETYLKIPYLYPQETEWVVKAYLRIGRIYEDTEKWEEAKAAYKKILGLNVKESKFAQERVLWIEQNSPTKL